MPKKYRRIREAIPGVAPGDQAPCRFRLPILRGASPGEAPFLFPHAHPVLVAKSIQLLKCPKVTMHHLVRLGDFRQRTLFVSRQARFRVSTHLGIALT